MSHYAPLYDPPLVADLAEDREKAWAGKDDQQLYLHIGFFIYWYASAETAITVMLNRFTGRQHPTSFHLLTRGMDAKLKCERLKEAIEHAGCTIEQPLAKRFEHFTRRLSTLRNQLVHNFPYYRNDAFQLVSVGAPPHDPEDPIEGAPKPQTIPSLELYERAKWLQAFANDLYKILETVTDVRDAKGTLARESYWSSLPTGDRPGPEKQARRANADKRAQTPQGK
jgi:hypothetical protein